MFLCLTGGRRNWESFGNNDVFGLRNHKPKDHKLKGNIYPFTRVKPRHCLLPCCGTVTSTLKRSVRWDTCVSGVRSGQHGGLETCTTRESDIVRRHWVVWPKVFAEVVGTREGEGGRICGPGSDFTGLVQGCYTPNSKLSSSGRPLPGSLRGGWTSVALRSDTHLPRSLTPLILPLSVYRRRSGRDCALVLPTVGSDRSLGVRMETRHPCSEGQRKRRKRESGLGRETSKTCPFCRRSVGFTGGVSLCPSGLVEVGIWTLEGRKTRK